MVLFFFFLQSLLYFRYVEHSNKYTKHSKNAKMRGVKDSMTLIYTLHGYLRLNLLFFNISVFIRFIHSSFDLQSGSTIL